MKLTSTIGLAFEAITRNKLRSALTSLGIIMGVGAVIVMMALGDGAKASIEQRVASLGTDVITVSAGSANVGGVRMGQGAVTTLTEEDAAAIAARVSGVRGVSPGVSTRTQIVAAGGNWQTQVQGTGAAFAGIRAWDLALGSFFTDEDVERASRVVVLGAGVRDQVFGAGANPVGEIVRVSNQPFRVIGVLGRKGQSAMGQDQDDTVIAPYTAVQKRLLGTQHLSSVLVAAKPDVAPSQLTAAVTALLRERHRIGAGEADDFAVRSPEEMSRVLSATTDTMAYLLASVAAISLVVGGIGIMNIMLVSVTERTREIGLRRALGARRSDVLRQFVAEALSLSLAGGALGVALGALSSYALSAMLNWATDVSSVAVLTSFGFAAAVGVVFGFVPARKAAALMPTEALRYE
jgi:putative ABC transport system permease protein